jgi:hypothetical protein
MSRIVLIHGIGQQYKGPESLRGEWQPALNDGILAAGGTKISTDDIGIAFYGDLFRPNGRRIGEPDLDASDVIDPFDKELLLAWWESAASEDPRVPAPYDGTRVRTPYLVQRALGALGHSRFFAGIAERALIMNLRQVRRYFTEPDLRQAIINRVNICVGPRTRVIVGHSLGSVVAYEALCAHPQWTINTFVTLGSPLGMRGLVFDRLSPAPKAGRGAWPGQTDKWVNVFDNGDIVATEKYLSSLFGPEVLDHAVHNGSHAHDVRPYLTARETGTAIVHAMRASTAAEDVD